jgi:hypothetical protein
MRHPSKIHASFQMFGRTNPMPEDPSLRNTFATVTGAKEYYKREARDSGHDYMLADGYGGGPASWVDLFDASGWDGVSYGEPYARLEFTSDRLGIRVESF